MSDSVNETGLFVSLRRFLATALEMAQARLDLLGTEIEFEKRRLFTALLWAAVALLLLGIGLVLLCGFVILLFWDGYRLPAVGVLATLFLAAGAALTFKANFNFFQKKNIFTISLSELEKDHAALSSSRQNEQR